MFKIIGGDGKEYGPISTEQLRQWLAENRVNAQTQVQREGTTEWVALGSVPEFAASFGPATGAPTGGGTPPPVAGAVDPERLAAEILARDYEVRIGDCIGRAWRLVKTNFWLFVLATALAMLITSIPVVNFILTGPVLGGLYLMFLRRRRGEAVQFGDLFTGFSIAFVPLMLGYIVSQLLGTLGLVLCLLPGIYLLVSWVFTVPLIIDKGIEFWPAMELSRKVVTRHWWQVFGLLLLGGLVGTLGALACGIGIFVTIPIMFGAVAMAYEDIFNSKPTPIITPTVVG